MNPNQSVIKIEKETFFECYLTATLDEENIFVKEEIEIKDKPPSPVLLEYSTIKEGKQSTLDQKEHHDSLTLPCNLPTDCIGGNKEASFEYYLTAAVDEEDIFIKEEIEIKDETPSPVSLEYSTIRDEKQSILDQKEHHDAPTLPCNLTTDCINVTKRNHLQCFVCEQGSSETQPHKKKLFKSKQCLFHCSQKRSLTSHLKKHTEEKPYKCEQYSYRYAHKSSLIVHLKSHTGEKPYKCGQCSYRSAYKSHLIRHLKNHTGEKPYKCEQCSYKCVQKVQLIQHLVKHTDEKPYKCEQCSYRCAQKRNLIVHLRKHTGEKPYKCQQCSYGCARRESLIVHLKKHKKPYKCKKCSCKYVRKVNLIRHLKTHAIEKPYKCDQCSYRTVKKRNLIWHLKSHTE